MDTSFDYEPTELDDEIFLSQVPLQLIENSINQQFEDPLEYRKKDYIQSFITKYDYSKEYMEDDDELVQLDLFHEEFLVFLEKVFEEKLSIGFPDLDTMDEEDQHELVHLTYRFFIKNIKKNFINVVMNYIEDHRKDIQNFYEKKKDVTSLTFKSEIDDETDVIILANLIEIIHNILDFVEENCDVDDFLKLCQDDEVVLETEFVKSAYDRVDITGNFIESYVDMVDENFISVIQSKVRNKILKKYPKRTKKDEDVSEDEEQE